MRTYGYNLKGRKAKIYRRYWNWGPHITAVPVISTEGLLDVGFYRGHVDSEKFLEFVNNVLAPCLLPFNGFNPRSIVILGKVTSSLLYLFELTTNNIWKIEAQQYTIKLLVFFFR